VAIASLAYLIEGMKQRHLHADANYRTIRRFDETFGVEVTIPESYPRPLRALLLRRTQKPGFLLTSNAWLLPYLSAKQGGNGQPRSPALLLIPRPHL
jgi:hypothetical protein